MANTKIENRAYFTINGQKYSLAALVKDIVWDTGSIAKTAQAMTPDGFPAGNYSTNYSPTIQWTELIPDNAGYVKLLGGLSIPGGVTIVIQPFIIGDTTPSGKATSFEGCRISNQNVSMPSQDIEGVRRIQIIATSYSEL